jgi:hypothetical protein
MVTRDLTTAIEDARWSEAAGTAAYLLEADPITVQRAAAATLILISAQLGELNALLRQKFEMPGSESPFLLERGELFIDQPHVYAKKRDAAA